MASSTSPRRRRIGLLANTLSYSYQNDIFLGAHQELSRQNVDLFCFSGGRLSASEPSSQQRSAIYDLIGPGTLDGLILTTSTLAHEVGASNVLAFCRRFAPVPICSIGYQVDGVCSLLVENTTGVRQLTAHLAEVHNRRRIAFVTGPSFNLESRQRLAGYRAGLDDQGVPFDPALVIPGDFTREAGMEAVRRLFDDGPGCDAIAAANDWTALGVLEALDRRGIRVPGSVSVVGFDDIDDARFATPPLTTIHQPIHELGVQAARLVMAQADGRPTLPTVSLPTSVRVRQSCGCFYDVPRVGVLQDTRGASGRTALVWDQEVLVRVAAAAGPEIDPSVAGDWPRRLIGALLSDVSQGTDQAFVSTLDELLRQVAGLGNIHAWHNLVAALRARCFAHLANAPGEWARVGLVFERAHIMVSDVAERVQGRRRLDHEILLRILQETGAALRAAFDRPSIARALVEQLPRVGVPSFYVALHRSATLAPESEAELIMAHDGAPLVEAGAEPPVFRGGELVPGDFLPPRRLTMVIEPLFVGRAALGFSALELGPRDGAFFETLREQLSAALSGARLLESVVEEATRREQAERARLADEMRIATRIQTGILPRITQVAGLEIATVMVPATEVGGDYFDVLPFDGGCWLGIGDVAGHGLPTGLVMLMIQSIVAATTHGRPAARPADVWKAVNAVLYDNVRQRLQQEEHATLTLIRYETDGSLAFAGAHEPLVIVRAATGRSEVLHTPGTWAGIVRDVSGAPAVQETASALGPGDVLILHSDGITEAMNREGESFEISRLCRAAEAVARRPVEEIRDHIMAAVCAFTGTQVDDRTLVVVRHVGG
jgi:DNA-binding LacI/PurR family transcriptional regulator/serine phosphatase RsbU (regulator of sigma subunit)